jgi:hypothetical protein
VSVSRTQHDMHTSCRCLIHAASEHMYVLICVCGYMCLSVLNVLCVLGACVPVCPAFTNVVLLFRTPPYLGSRPPNQDNTLCKEYKQIVVFRSTIPSGWRVL